MSFRIGGDYELMLRELKTAEAAFIPDIILTAMRQGGLSSNTAISIEVMRDIRRAQKVHGQYFPSAALDKDVISQFQLRSQIIN